MIGRRYRFDSLDAEKEAHHILVTDPTMTDAAFSAGDFPAMDPRRSVDETPVIVLHPATRGGQPEEAA
jgi:hypothetical protein